MNDILFMALLLFYDINAKIAFQKVHANVVKKFYPDIIFDFDISMIVISNISCIFAIDYYL
jgi:hypothetical protein